MVQGDISLMAHLMRRAGFGASYEELERRVANGYEATVEELLNPEAQPDLQMDLLLRHFVDWKQINGMETNQTHWTYRMINTHRPLEEKICLFWHGIFCVGDSKCMNGRQILLQLNKFRKHGLGQFPNLLMEVGQRPSHGLLSGQPDEPQGCHQRELGARVVGAVLFGRGDGWSPQL